MTWSGTGAGAGRTHARAEPSMRGVRDRGGLYPAAAPAAAGCGRPLLRPRFRRAPRRCQILAAAAAAAAVTAVAAGFLRATGFLYGIGGGWRQRRRHPAICAGLLQSGSAHARCVGRLHYRSSCTFPFPSCGQHRHRRRRRCQRGAGTSSSLVSSGRRCGRWVVTEWLWLHRFPRCLLLLLVRLQLGLARRRPHRLILIALQVPHMVGARVIGREQKGAAVQYGRRGERRAKRWRGRDGER